MFRKKAKNRGTNGKRGAWKKALRCVLITLIALIAICSLADIVCCKTLEKYIASFEPVDYSNASRALPAYDEALGHYTFSNEDGMKVLFLTDFHIGGGRWTYRKDRKTIYETITMLQKEKPDLVVLGGDNTFACPGPIYRGGGTLNNKMVSRIVLELFEHTGVYFTTVFGNHDAEVFDLFSREKLSAFYESGAYHYCIYRSEFSDKDAALPSVTNQMIAVKGEDGDVNKVLLLVDSNAYVDKSIRAVLSWDYDVIHPAQIAWAKDEIQKVRSIGTEADEASPETIAFMHIPTGEYQAAYEALRLNDFRDTADVQYLGGVWNEEDGGGEDLRIFFGGCKNFRENPTESDRFVEELGPEGIDALEAVFCGHDHVNNAAIRYKGVTLAYGLSMDNTAYKGIEQSGLQRGATLIEIAADGTMTWRAKNAYHEYGVETDRFFPVYLDRYYNEAYAPF